MSQLTNDSVLNRLQEQFGPAIISHEVPYGLLTVEVQSEKAHDMIAWLKEDDVLKMSFLTLIGAVHYPDQKGRELCVNYHIHSLVHNVRLRIRAFVPIAEPNIATITDIYIGADW